MRLCLSERRRTISVLGWPTDVISIDHVVDDGDCLDYNHRDPRPPPVHTVLFWIPGNPGQHDWYNSDFVDILTGLGRGYAVRSISHAGHGLLGKSNMAGSNGDSITDVERYCRFRGNDDGTSCVSPLIPWTVEGQVLHKIAYVDYLLSSIAEGNHQDQIQNKRNRNHKDHRSCEFTPDLKLILIGHSFGCHVVQRMCVLRPDILERVSGFLFLMPYIRTKPSSTIDQKKLEFAVWRSELLVAIGTKCFQALRSIPDSIIRRVIRRGIDGCGDEDENITNIIEQLLQNPGYPRNFFELGTEELRDIPNEIDIAALRLLTSYRPSISKNNASDRRYEIPRKGQQRRPIFFLYAGDNDQWCPSFHREEIIAFQASNLLPLSIKTTKIPDLRHDYVCQNRQIRSRVNAWIISNIHEIKHGVILRTNADGDSERLNSVNEGFGVRNLRPTSTMLPSKL